MLFSCRHTQKKILLFFLIFLIFGGVILDVAPVYAADGVLGTVGSIVAPVVAPIGEAAGNLVLIAIKWLLYGILVVLGWFVSAAVTLFEWAINPQYFQDFFNTPSTYEMWKFVRDFLNLFFILALLYIAFTIVFQVAKDYKKAILHLVIMALLVNFSFPISRVLIDATNVPMYFFVNQITAGKSEKNVQILSGVLSASRLENILIHKENGEFHADEKNSVPRLIIAVVFMFIFATTLVVLAILFLIRIIALLILVIFSSVGFVGSVIPGAESLSEKWWKYFWDYAFFGPAAMLMILIATRFFDAVSEQQLYTKMQDASSALSATGATTEFIAALAQFSIPIVMLWFAMGLGKSFSLVGADMVVGKGQKFSKWAGKKVLYNNPVASIVRGTRSGLKKAGMEGKIAGFNYGKYPGGKFLTGDYWASPSKLEATVKGGIANGWGGGKKERGKLHQKEVNDRVKKDKENEVSNSTHRQNLKSGDPVEREAAALALANDKEIRTAEELSQVIDALKDNSDGLLKAIENAKSDAVENMDSASYQTARDMHYERDKGGNFVLDAAGNRVVKDGMQRSLEALNNRTKKEGNIRVQVEYELNQLPGGVAGAAPAQVQTAVDNVLRSMKSAKDVANSESLFDDPYRQAAINHIVARGPAHVQEVKKASAQEGTSVGNLLPNRNP